MIPLFKVFMNPSVGPQVVETLFSGVITQGPKVEEYEAQLRQYFGLPHILTVNSGTSALQLALDLAGVNAGDTVISTPQTCSASNTAILSRQANIVWADVDPNTGNVTAKTVERALEHAPTSPKAIMMVHWGGLPCDLQGINSVAKKYGLKTIEDAAHAIGAKYQGAFVGAWSDYTAFSTQAIKHLTSVVPETPVLIKDKGQIRLVRIGLLDSAVVGQECASFDSAGVISWKKITGFIKHPVKDYIYTIRTEKGRQVQVTGSHSLFSYCNGAFIPVVASKLKVGDYIAVPRKISMADSGKGATHIDVLDLLREVRVTVCNDQVRLAYEGRGGNAGKTISRFIPITKEFCKLLGYYAAEGGVYSTKHKGTETTYKCLAFSFGSHEEHTYVAEVKRILSELFPAFSTKSYITGSNESSCRVTVSSTLLALLFSKLGGTGAYYKRVPDFLWNATEECKLAFFEGLVNGDGHRRSQDGYTPYESVRSISPELVNGVHYLLLSLGIQSSIEERLHETPVSKIVVPGYTLTVINKAGQEQSRENCVPKQFIGGFTGSKHSATLSTVAKKYPGVPANLLEHVALLRIKAISREKYQGDVYDFEVSGTENFVGGFGAICLHNTGDGGLLMCKSEKNHNEGKLLRWFGLDRDGPKKSFRCELDLVRPGYKYHMNDINATMGIENLKVLPWVLERHRENAQYYYKQLRPLIAAGITLMDQEAGYESSHWLFTLRFPEGKRDLFEEYMASQGVQCSQVHSPNHKHTFAKNFGPQHLPGVELFSSTQTNIPVGWWVTFEEREHIVKSIHTFALEHLT